MPKLDLSRIERAERLRSYFELQLTFAEAMARREGRALVEAVGLYTNLMRRFGLAHLDETTRATEWSRFCEPLGSLGSAVARSNWARDFYLAMPEEPAPPGQPVFGCFRLELRDADTVVRLHFNNADSADDIGPLAGSKIEARRDELRAMFAFVRGTHRTARTVLGGSWLYNLEAYRRLFPEVYGQSRHPPEGHVRLNGTSSWGQFVNHREFVKDDLRRILLERLETLDLEAPWRAFPFPALNVQAPVETFYEFYGS